MNIGRMLLAATSIAALSAGAAPAADLTIAGRDGGYGKALSMAVAEFEAMNGVDVDRLELPYGGPSREGYRFNA